MDTRSWHRFAAYGSPPLPGADGAPRQRPLGIALGVAASLLLHALLIYGYRLEHRPNPAVDDGRRVEAMTVWIRPLARPAPAPEAPLPAAVAPRQPTLANHPARRPVPQAPMTVLPAPSDSAIPSPAPDHPADTIVNNDPLAPAPPRFDMEAARRSARAIASAADPERAKTALGQIPDRPLATDTKLARDMAQAKRGDCKDGLPGGLLAPVFLLMEKKGTGCKW